MANSTPQIRHSPRDSPILIGQDCTVEFPSYPPQSRDPYFLLRDRIEHQMAKVKSVKDIHSIQQDLVTLKQTIDSVLENSTLFPHINASVELPKRMAFYQSMSARLAALKRGAEVGNPELLNQDPQASPSSSTAVTTTFHFEVPCTDQQRHLDHLISVVGNVREQAHQINSEIETQKRYVSCTTFSH